MQPGNLEAYRVFYVIAKTGSLTKAAEELYITQPAVTQSLKQLEARLGGALFFRTSKGVKLTAEGEVLFKYIEQAYQFIVNGERKLAEMHQFLSGDIKIGAGDTLCKHFLLPYLKRFHEAYPNIKIGVTNRTTPETVKLLKEGAIDLGIVNLPVPQDKQLHVRESLTIRDGFVAGAKYGFLAEKPVSLEELSGYPLILLEKGSSSRAYFDAVALERGVAVKPEIELGSLDLLVEFARNGLGIACVIRSFVENELASSDLVEVRLEPPLPPRSIGIVTLKDVPLSASSKKFLELLP
ncbi:LysR family transcriptional regulator [Paenibacillus filicis]|uniref:LysR family transcriptional regulator n=1 Tax=Paenibacillus gyeongsangnamensis TaxID=3388067 RepID=A0ABT4QKJ9_9BACL|nr:LysR family transcriptional regulator [Paenibacillus filicis]MCZ8517395.1 LysR family transcriptional regulator [Paenibacillus filicis]